MSSGSFLSEQEKGNGDTEIKLLFLFFQFCNEKPFWGVCPKAAAKLFATMDLTVAHWAALALWLDGARAGQDRTDDRVTDHGSFLRERGKKIKEMKM